jgi:hypothetical protein
MQRRLYTRNLGLCSGRVDGALLESEWFSHWQDNMYSVQSSWLQIQRSGFDSWCYQISSEVVGLERGPLSLVSTIEELHGRESSGSCLENREYGRGDPSRWPRGTIYPQELALTSPTSGGRSIGIVHSPTKATELLLRIILLLLLLNISWKNCYQSAFFKPCWHIVSLS